ncbi:MAG TPA: hypothetical protein VGZ73_09740 [Bryobacteraceae bacterium]|jgi:hypothetical protein|nr:hypothetical protein [Bryobacteraceae bacterium]
MGQRCSLTNYGARAALLTILLALASFQAFAADICAPTDIYGPYGLQLAGTTTITGKETPIASIGRLSFDGEGGVSGVSSVNFNGLFLGNPTTGSYEFNTDCTLTFRLQDTSGAFQHFSGKAAPGGHRVEIRQTDPGTGERGLMVRSADSCSAADFRGQYNFTMTGSATPLAGEGTKGSVSAKALVVADANGNLTVTHGNSKTSGTYTVESDCLVQLEFGLADGDSVNLLKLRGTLVNGGKEVLAVQTDPEQVAAARFSQ